MWKDRPGAKAYDASIAVRRFVGSYLMGLCLISNEIITEAQLHTKQSHRNRYVVIFCSLDKNGIQVGLRFVKSVGGIEFFNSQSSLAAKFFLVRGCERPRLELVVHLSHLRFASLRTRGAPLSLFRAHVLTGLIDNSSSISQPSVLSLDSHNNATDSYCFT